MLGQSKFRRTAGFIRINSSKALETMKQPIQTSSDEFSSFQKGYKNEESDHQFSPYRHHLHKFKNRPPLPEKPVADKEVIKMFSNQKLRKNYLQNNFMESPRSSNKGKIVNRSDIKIERKDSKKQLIQKQLINIGNICSQISKKHGSPTHKFQHNIYPSQKSQVKQVPFDNRYKETKITNENQNEDDVQNEFSFDEQILNGDNQNRNTLNYQKFKENQVYQPVKHKKKPEITYQFEESSVSAGEEQEDSESYFFEGTFKKTQKPYQPREVEKIKKNVFLTHDREDEALKIRHEKARERFISKNDLESPSSEEQPEELIMQYPVDQFKKTTIKECVEANYTNTINKDKAEAEAPGLYKTRGGVCFDLDVNEFAKNCPPEKPRQNNQALRKPKKANKKEEILKRRQMAKNYDKQARARVFGGF